MRQKGIQIEMTEKEVAINASTFYVVQYFIKTLNPVLIDVIGNNDKHCLLAIKFLLENGNEVRGYYDKMIVTLQNALTVKDC